MHVTARTVDRRPAFVDDADCERFLRTLSKTVRRSRWRCAAYCLMPNHHHLVLQLPDEPSLSRGMHLLNGVFARRYNERHGRRGHLFKARFHSTLIESDAHLLETLRYVVLNPCRARLSRRPEEWPWSSFRACAGLEPTPPFLDASAVWELFADSPGSDARTRYALFTMERLRG